MAAAASTHAQITGVLMLILSWGFEGLFKAIFEYGVKKNLLGGDWLRAPGTTARQLSKLPGEWNSDLVAGGCLN